MALSCAAESGAVARAKVSFGAAAARRPDSSKENAVVARRTCPARISFCSRRTSRVPGGVQAGFLEAPWPPVGRWGHHRAKQTPVPERTFREPTAETTPVAKRRKNLRQQTQRPAEPEESSGQDGNQ